MVTYATILSLLLVGCARTPAPRATPKPPRRQALPRPVARPAAPVTSAQERAVARNTVILDVRTATEYANMRVAGARHLDFLSPTFDDELRALDADRTYLVYCGSGHLAGKTVRRMKTLGFKADNLGGFPALRERGLPLEGLEH